MDDIVATGWSSLLMLKLTRQAGARAVGIGVILIEGHDCRESAGVDVSLVAALGHHPRFKVAWGCAKPDPATLAHC